MNKHDLENAKRALEEFKQEKKNEVNMFMENIVSQIKDFLAEENNKEQDKFVKNYIRDSFKLLEDPETSALEKYSYLMHGIGAFQTFKTYINQEPDNKEELPFQKWLVGFNDYVNDLIK